jgi:hypothetical protein
MYLLSLPLELHATHSIAPFAIGAHLDICARLRRVHSVVDSSRVRGLANTRNHLGRHRQVEGAISATETSDFCYVYLKRRQSEGSRECELCSGRAHYLGVKKCQVFRVRVTPHAHSITWCSDNEKTSQSMEGRPNLNSLRYVDCPFVRTISNLWNASWR